MAPRVRECAQDERPLELALESVADAPLAPNERLRELVIERVPPQVCAVSKLTALRSPSLGSPYG